jgi:hypothetical protein
MALAYSEAKKIAIVDYLARLGFEPTRVRGNDYWYRSPFRGERDASFKVNVKLNLWYDHGEGVGGTLLDLGSKLHSCTIKEFVDRLENHNLSFENRSNNIRREPAENRVEILGTRKINDDALVKYLCQRKIDLSNANKYCEEVDFKIANRSYKAVGIQNKSGGYELRNSWFKGSSSPKDVTLIRNGSDSLVITEGFFDYLSLHQLKQNELQKTLADSDHLILNSIAFVNKSLPVIKTYNLKQLYLDNDPAAEKAKAFLTASNIQFQDRSILYAKHKDLNEFLTKEAAISQTSNRRRSIRP